MQNEQDGWSSIPIQRKSKTVTVHSQETIDGVLYITATTYDNENVIMTKTLTRADLCVASQKTDY